MKHLDRDKAKLVKGIKLEQVVIDKFSISVEHEHVQHAGGGRTGDHALRNHSYLIPQGFDLKHAVAFAHGNALKWMAVPKQLSVHNRDKPIESVQKGLDTKADEDEKEREEEEGKSDCDSDESNARSWVGCSISDVEDAYSSGHSRINKVNCEVATIILAYCRCSVLFVK